MTIATRRVPMPPKSAPERTSELRKALIRITAGTDEAVLLFPDETADLAKLRNRASGATTALKKDGLHFVTRTTEAVPPGSPEGTEPVKCVGVWKTLDENAAVSPAPEEQVPADDTEDEDLFDSMGEA